jgi:hypothetical protein
MGSVSKRRPAGLGSAPQIKNLNLLRPETFVRSLTTRGMRSKKHLAELIITKWMIPDRRFPQPQPDQYT